ncbi:helix-turn-helix domain-containing protein [Magnetofaba australis]|uniref:helix-turn-helix domain-containing protein n=1 Tax=Magnetofaba australis TaxID=1472297 RepID=UPI000A19C518|nr:helix-turn-helix domain-containing protein [Magnetofaba australis]
MRTLSEVNPLESQSERSTRSQEQNALISRLAFSPSEAASVSGISRCGIYQAINKGQLRAKKHGARTLILKDDLLSFLNERPDFNTEE